MEKKETKKKKLTLTVSTKKPINVSQYSHGYKKKSIVIEKKISRTKNERRFYNRSEDINRSKPDSSDKAKLKKPREISHWRITSRSLVDRHFCLSGAKNSHFWKVLPISIWIWDR